MPSIQAAFSDFFRALAGIATAILNSIFAVFQTILALAQELFGSVFHLFHAMLQLVTDLTQGVAGFVFGKSHS